MSHPILLSLSPKNKTSYHNTTLFIIYLLPFILIQISPPLSLQILPINTPPLTPPKFKPIKEPFIPTKVSIFKFQASSFKDQMADIAMLVAEEYERRLRIAKKGTSPGGLSDSGERHRFEMVYSVAKGLKQKVDEEKSKILSYNWAWEPKTQISVAASHSFFSA